MQAVVVLQRRPQLLGGSTVLAAILAEQRQHHLPQPGQVLRRVALATAAAVFSEEDIQAPMLSILDAPVGPNPLRQFGGRGGAATDVVGFFHTLLVSHPPRAPHLHHRLEIDPLLCRAQPLRLVQHHVDAFLVAPMALLLTDEQVVPDPLQVDGQGILERGLDVGVQGRLVVLDRQQVVAACVPDLLGNGFLAADGGDADQRPVQVQQLQQLRYGHDLIALVANGDLGQAQAVLGGPGADQVQGGAVGPAAAAYGLAVDRNMKEAQGITDGVDPAGEAVLEGQRVQRREDSVEGVMRRRAVRQRQTDGPQPGLLGAAEAGDGIPGAGATEDRAQGDDEDIAEQVMVPEGRMAGVGKGGEVVGDVQGGRGRRGRGHGRVSDGSNSVSSAYERTAQPPIPPISSPESLREPCLLAVLASQTRTVFRWPGVAMSRWPGAEMSLPSGLYATRYSWWRGPPSASSGLAFFTSGSGSSGPAACTRGPTR